MYYDPDDPEISILEPDRKDYFIDEIILFIILPAMLFILLFRRYSNQKEELQNEELEEKLNELVEDEEKTVGKQ